MRRSFTGDPITAPMGATRDEMLVGGRGFASLCKQVSRQGPNEGHQDKTPMDNIIPDKPRSLGKESDGSILDGRQPTPVGGRQERPPSGRRVGEYGSKEQQVQSEFSPDSQAPVPRENWEEFGSDARRLFQGFGYLLAEVQATV